MSEQKSCSASCGIGRERDRQLQEAKARAERAYPGLVWSSHRAWEPEELPVALSELQTLEKELTELLPTRSFLRWEGDAPALFLLAGLHEGCWIEQLETPTITSAPPNETYLRISFSTLGRYYTLQEVRFRFEHGWLEQEQLLGVEDRRLQLFVKAVQGHLRRRALISLDAAVLSEELDHGEESLLEAYVPTLRVLLFGTAATPRIQGSWIAENSLS